MKLYHRTARANAESILREGFRDHTDYYMTRNLYTGVWFSSTPLDVNEGILGDTVLCLSLDLNEADLAQYEWVEEGKGYREWLMPAALVNINGEVAIMEDLHG
jgi:hypothetical protein